MRTRCKKCKSVLDKGVFSHCPECGYPYDLPTDERPEDWTEEAE